MTDRLSNPIPYKQVHPGLQFLILVGLLLAFIIFGQILASGVVGIIYGSGILFDIADLKLTSVHVQKALFIMQTIGGTLPLLITPIIFSYFIVHEPRQYLKNNFRFSPALIAIIFLIMLLAFPLVEFFTNINHEFPLSKGLQDYEHKVQKMSDAMLQMNTFGGMIFDVLFIGLLTAIVEEALFRGAMQTVFIQWIKNKHVAIWIVAILFSAFHMEFSGFLPRMFLGLLFGYFTIWSGSIWPAIWAHFLNNGIIVIITYMAQQKLVNIDPDNQHSFNSVIYIVSGVIMIALLYFYHYVSVKKQIAYTNGEELD